MFVFYRVLLVVSFVQICYPFFEILRRFGVYILAKCCGSFNTFVTYFLRSLDSGLAFRKWIFYTIVPIAAQEQDIQN